MFYKMTYIYMSSGNQIHLIQFITIERQNTIKMQRNNNIAYP